MLSTLEEKSLLEALLSASIAHVWMRKVERAYKSEALQSGAGVFSVGFVASVGFIVFVECLPSSHADIWAFNIVHYGKSMSFSL